jgi:hypothetical protein
MILLSRASWRKVRPSFKFISRPRALTRPSRWEVISHCRSRRRHLGVRFGFGGRVTGCARRGRSLRRPLPVRSARLGCRPATVAKVAAADRRRKCESTPGSARHRPHTLNETRRTKSFGRQRPRCWFLGVRCLSGLAPLLSLVPLVGGPSRTRCPSIPWFFVVCHRLFLRFLGLDHGTSWAVMG